MTYSSDFRLIMISAMYENGGNTLHRFLDGHPELFVYPFESQLGNNRAQDFLSSLFPFKYRYPDFPLSGRPQDDYELFFDEELKTYLRARHVSKFREVAIDLDEVARKRLFCDIVEQAGRTRANVVAAFFDATFRAWKDVRRSGKEIGYVGYSPVIGFDGEAILSDFPSGHVVHIVRNPWSGYADTVKRPFPLSLQRYALTWSLMQHFAVTLARRFPQRFLIVRAVIPIVERPEARSGVPLGHRSPSDDDGKYRNAQRAVGGAKGGNRRALPRHALALWLREDGRQCFCAKLISTLRTMFSRVWRVEIPAMQLRGRRSSPISSRPCLPGRRTLRRCRPRGPSILFIAPDYGRAER